MIPPKSTAKTLRDLLKIRRHPANAKFFRKLPNCFGTAVGYKYKESERRFEGQDGRRIPAILVFVKEKIPEASLAPGLVIPKKFFGPGGLECSSDVMLGDAPDRPMNKGRLSGVNAALQRELHEKDLGVIGGIPIEPPGVTGTAGCVVTFPTDERNEKKRNFGVLTNFHIAGFEGTRVIAGGGRVFPLGTTERSYPFAPAPDSKDSNALGNYLRNGKHRIDIGLIRLSSGAAARRKKGVHGIMPLGTCFELNIDSMEPIGAYVVGVGQALGQQEGQIMAYGYEWRNDVNSTEWCGTDYLILSTSSQPFAAPGDSGKLVVTNDEKRQPIALLWGGERHDFWNVQAQASCAYATDIGLALRLFKAAIY